ncbi:MAG: hypothetical protein AAF570_27180, partial [Bacteroidota bacterium]
MMRSLKIGMILMCLSWVGPAAFGQGANQLYNDARGLYHENEFQQAEEKLWLALKIQKIFPDAWYLMGQCYWQRKQYRKAV